jgi:hypothetical protein
MKLFLCIIFLLPLFFQAGCNSVDTDSSEARIVFGKSIDEVHFGDSKEIVQAKLGISDRGGIADGVYWNWFVSEYLKGSHAGLSVYFLEEPINTSGPVDILTVHSPYSGKTKEGIGIDASVNEVRGAFGEPKIIDDNYSSEAGTYTYIYCIDGKRLQIGFKEDKVEGMGLGIYKSPPNNECQ